ncbi:hypothetical protein CHCC19466_1240 [Bacillus licheniformis]|nr:hypothetical protein CHCC20373_2592 [Bacillus licheniformis]TWL15782.1 hypothetical protein CHCC19466_1240 [Bacillus licheniformis]TWL86098.1 hypothetical protein CHCC15291_1917 [Bacillus licheniformis]TWM04850.1 hypothetical protein CHCC15289_0085 [Bacillus licheniformis]
MKATLIDLRVFLFLILDKILILLEIAQRSLQFIDEILNKYNLKCL